MKSIPVIRMPSWGLAGLCVASLIGCGEKSHTSPAVTARQEVKQTQNDEAPADATAKAPDAATSAKEDRKLVSADDSKTQTAWALAEHASATPSESSSQSDVEEQWSAFLADASNHYGFDAKQTDRAQVIYKQTVAAAKAKRRQDGTEGGPSPSVKLTRELKRLTNQFIDRVDSIASAEQINNAAKEGFKSPRWQDRPPPPNVGAAAPEWRLQGPDGKTVTLASLKGKVVIVEFWGSWCPACRNSLPGFQRLSEQYKENDNVEVVGISCEKGKGPTGALNLIKKEKYTFDVLLNGEQIASRYDVTGYPTLFVIGQDGKIVHKLRGVGRNVDKTLTPIIEEALKKNEA